MAKSKDLLFSEGDTPEQQKSPLASTEEQSQERVYGSDNLVMERDSVESDVTEQNIEGYFKIVDQIHEKASSILKFSLQCDDVIESLEKEEERLRVVEAREKRISLIEDSLSRRLRELDEKEIESDLRLVIEATFKRLVLEKQSEEVLTQLKTHENQKLCELEKVEKDFDLKQRVEIERRNEECEAREKAIKEKTAELKRKEETFELRLKDEVEKWREENELKRKGLDSMEKTLEKRLKNLDLKQMELEERSKQEVTEAETRKRSNSELEPPLLVKNDSDATSLTHLPKKRKSHEANDGAIEGIVCTDKSDEEPKSLTCSDTKFNDFSKSMSSFTVDQVWALYDPRDDMPRIYAQIRRIFDSQLSLQVTLLEHVKTIKDEKSILTACGRFEYGDTEIKSHLMFAHEMHHIKYDNSVIVNPRKGETWALYRDWDISWSSHPDLHEPPYRYDFVEIISEFDDLQGIAVAYIGRVQGFVSVFNHAEQHGVIKIIISPDEMQRFSHKVESVKLRGEEKEGIPASSFLLNPAVTPSYDPVLEEAVEMKIQSKDCGKAPSVEDQNGSTKDRPITID
ncbi:hypothetical protein V5N11_015362 [Cardamine amara subsp. amara]|uniref:DUF3444 domain-containing protein n=1 Tax=Cardamine amara subsp. amara TaxID=228776 RepID=A0ABD1A8H6_CARAN